MNLPWFWDCLDLTPAASVRDVKRRYSQLLKLNRPEDNPQGFQQLRAAYEICLRLAQQREEAEAGQAGEETGQADSVPAAAGWRPAAPEPLARPAQAMAQTTPLPGPPPAPAPPPAAPFRLEPESPPPPAAQPVTRIDADLPPAPPQKIDASTIGKFLPVDAPLPQLRPAPAVVDELLHLDGADPAALPRWFARCPEMANFEQRDAVELELLQRLAAGARPSLAALKLASDEFGWRELGFARRLAARGISGPRWQAIDDALHQAFADAQFITHMQEGGRLLQENIGPQAEKRLLARLHAQRGQRPSLWRAFLAADVLRVNNLLHAYAERYGGRALYHVFGAPFLDFWRDAHPGSAPNWRRFRLLTLRVLAYLLPTWLGLMIVAGNSEAEPAALGMNEPQVFLSLFVLLLMAGFIGYGGANLAFQHFQQHGWQRFSAWRSALLEQTLAPWLHPLRALPLLLVLGGVLFLAQHWVDEVVLGLACAALVLALFGLSGLCGAICAVLLLTEAILEWTPATPPGIALAATVATGLAWAADRLTLTRLLRGRLAPGARRFGFCLALAVVVSVGSHWLHGALAG